MAAEPQRSQARTGRVRLLDQEQGFILQNSMIWPRTEALNAEARRTILKWRPNDSKITLYPDFDEGTYRYFNASGYGTADRAQRQHLSKAPDASTPLEHLDHRWNICRPPMKQEGGASQLPGSEHLGTHAAFHLDDDTSASGRHDQGAGGRVRGGILLKESSNKCDPLAPVCRP